MTVPPHDPDLEAHYVASLLAGYATDSSLNPDDLYTPHLRTLAHAYQTLPQPVGRRYEITNDNVALLYLPGLRDALETLGAPDAARLAGHGYRLATDGPVTSRHDTDKLRHLAAQRRELAGLDNRRAQILESVT